MNELSDYFYLKIQEKLVPFFRKYKFEFHKIESEHSAGYFYLSFNNIGGWQINIHHQGFYPTDYPWNMSILIGKDGFKNTTKEFDSVSIAYWKEKISPKEQWQKDAIKLNKNPYSINTKTEIDSSINQVIYDLENFCVDFLKRDDTRLNLIRQIKYLEYLTQIQVYGEYSWTGSKKFTISQNKPVD